MFNQKASNTITCITIPIRIHSITHTPIGCRILEQSTNLIDNEIMVCTHKMNSTTLQSFGALCCTTHHKHRLSQPRSLFLNTT